MTTQLMPPRSKAPVMLARPTCAGIEAAERLVDRQPRLQTGRTLDPLEDIAEIAECDSPAWAAVLWARARPKSPELLRLAKRVDLALDAKAVAVILEANPAFDCEAGRRIKAAVMGLIAGVMLAYEPSKNPRRRQKAS